MEIDANDQAAGQRRIEINFAPGFLEALNYLLLRRLASGEPLDKCAVGDIQGPPFAKLEATALAREAYTIFANNQSAVAVMNQGSLEGIVTKSDLLEFWAHS